MSVVVICCCWKVIFVYNFILCTLMAERTEKNLSQHTMELIERENCLNENCRCMIVRLKRKIEQSHLMQTNKSINLAFSIYPSFELCLDITTIYIAHYVDLCWESFHRCQLFQLVNTAQWINFCLQQVSSPLSIVFQRNCRWKSRMSSRLQNYWHWYQSYWPVAITWQRDICKTLTIHGVDDMMQLVWVLHSIQDCLHLVVGIIWISLPVNFKIHTSKYHFKKNRFLVLRLSHFFFNFPYVHFDSERKDETVFHKSLTK